MEPILNLKRRNRNKTGFIGLSKICQHHWRNSVQSLRICKAVNTTK